LTPARSKTFPGHEIVRECAFAFARYVAALDREELAARNYRRALELVGQPY
jgi:hypothetical protein